MANNFEYLKDFKNGFINKLINLCIIINTWCIWLKLRY